MKNLSFWAIMLIIAVTLTALVVGTSCTHTRQQKYQVTVAEEMGDLVAVINGTLNVDLEDWGKVTILQFKNGFALYQGDIPADSCTSREFIGFAPAGCYHINVAAPIEEENGEIHWIPFQLYRFLDSNVATETVIYCGKHYIQLQDFKQEEVSAENFLGLVNFTLPS